MASANDHYGQGQKGEESAFSSWVGEIQPDLGRFVYQLGVTIEELPNFQQLVLLQLHEQFEQLTPEQAKIQLYKITVQQIQEHSLHFENNSKPQVLGFPEDQELHTQLQKLDLAKRVPFALTRFHSLSPAEISIITEMQDHQLHQVMEEGARELQQHLQVDERQMQQRLVLLEKSYRRLVPPLPVDRELQRIDRNPSSPEESPKITEPPLQNRKKPFIVMGAAGLFLAAVIGASFTINDQQSETAGTTEYQKAEKVTDEMVADWQSRYKTIKETSPKRLGMSIEQYSQLDYVKQADAEMARTFSDESLRSLEDDPIEMQLAMDHLFRQIETPRGMTESLTGPNAMPSSEIEDFLRNYAAKTDELRVFADSVLLKYQEELESTIVMDQLSPEKLLAESENYPEKLRLLVESLPEYNLLAVVHPNGEKFRTVRDVHILNQQQPIASDPYAWQYLNLLSNEPYFDGSGFLMPIETIPQHLMIMEQALVEEGDGTSLFDGIEVAYPQVFWQLVKGSENSSVYDTEGKVKDDYRKAWNGLATSNPMAFLMLPILEEMEASDWTASAHYDELKFQDLLNALAMEKSGDLAEKLPNGNLMIEDEFVDMQDFDWSRIQPLYESFKSTYDLQLLADVPPLDVLFMYHYANKLGDTETLWHLLAASPLKPPLTEFEKEWKPIPDIAETAQWVELSGDFSKQRVKDKVYIYPQVQLDEYDQRLDLLLVTEKDRIWQIDYQQYESYDLLGADQQFKENVDSLYAAFTAGQQNQLPADTKPGEVAAVFFKAVENKDIQAMRKLSTETEWTDEEYVYFLELHSFRPFSELAQLAFATNFSAWNSGDLTGRAEIEYASGPQDSLFKESFLMKKTEDGWRMVHSNNY
ncbi:hypothetical protein [Planococcus sp. 4-30]|uniref:hypothetical protein n=1 Tax=Planococcus sp. 4-30 TaxID=2874583 RepID=UPI001CBF6475|nr:hypothetical protein [Planococcus sp. 4-30]